jgi:phosphosulfolactate phosphohydrolase-like enzyme
VYSHAREHGQQVLSFTTTLTVAADRNTRVFPFRVDDRQAAATLAAARKATLAVRRSNAGPGQVSLSPRSVRAGPGPLERLVLPSPNGSTISFQLAETGATVLGVSLRNRLAAADWLSRRGFGESSPRLAVIAAGERWPDGSLRPAVEDQWGAGALIEALRARGWSGLSPEAEAAAASYRAVAGDLGPRWTVPRGRVRATAHRSGPPRTRPNLCAAAPRCVPSAWGCVRWPGAVCGRPGAVGRCSVSGLGSRVSGLGSRVRTPAWCAARSPPAGLLGTATGGCGMLEAGGLRVV